MRHSTLGRAGQPAPANATIPLGELRQRLVRLVVEAIGLLVHARSPSMLPFCGLDRFWDVAVDTAGDLYVTDSGGRVLKLAVQR
jgi:hypothetical protein